MRVYIWDEFIHSHELFMVFEKTDRLELLIKILRCQGVDKNKIYILANSVEGSETVDVGSEKYRRSVFTGGNDYRQKTGFIFDGDWYKENDRDVIRMKEILIKAGYGENDILATSDEDEILFLNGG